MSDRRVRPLSLSVGRASPEDIQISHNRLVVVMILFGIVFAVLSLRVFEVSIITGGKVEARHKIFSPQKQFERTDIVDRNGVLLVSSLSTASLYANPQVVLDAKEAAHKLVKAFPDLEFDTVYHRLNSDKHFVWIKRDLPPEEQYIANSLGLPGLYFKDDETRIYPQGSLFSHLLGYVSTDGKGLSGVEKQFNKRLTQEFPREPLKLAVDVRVQQAVHTALLKVKDEYEALGAVAVVMDVNTGELISLVSLPDFDPNHFSQTLSDHKFNRASFGVYEMGSTFKIFNTAMAIESGKISLDDAYDVGTPLRVARFSIRDFKPQKGKMTVPEIFMYSSNIGSAHMALELGAHYQRTFLQKLGLLDRMNVDLPETSEPLYPKRWGKVSTMTISYGHGIAVSALHIINATATLVNGGLHHKMRILKQKDTDYTTSEQVVKKETSDAVRKVMRLAVQYGTGKNADAKGYLVGGKTGSADKVGGGDYSDGGVISSFVSAFPMNKPQYAVLVMVDEPKAQSRWGYVTGGTVAAPVVKEIISNIAPILNVQPVNEHDYEIRREFWYNDEAKQALRHSPNHTL